MFGRRSSEYGDGNDGLIVGGASVLLFITKGVRSMATMNVLQVQAMFATRPLTPEQAERLQAVRQAAASYAMVLIAATPDSAVRQMAIDAARQSFAFVEHAISLEQQGGRDSNLQRIKFFQQLKTKLSNGEAAKLAAMLGLVELVEEEKEQAKT